MDSTLINNAFLEDIPDGDLTTLSLKTTERFGVAHIIAKQDLVLSGTPLAEAAIKHVDSALELNWFFKNGDSVLKGQNVAQISGNLIPLVQAERVALNFLGYLSGIATQTELFVKACLGTKTQILDTRKTLPLYRKWAKKAVVDGGGTNHRMNLSDAVLIKENHITIAGGFIDCLQKVKFNTDKNIEVEVKTLEEAKMAIDFGVRRIMLDNMSLEEMKACLEVTPQSIETEASGNMTLERIPAVAALGLNYISVGALTHTVPNADFSMLFDWT